MTTYTEDDLRHALAGAADHRSPPADVWPRLHKRIVFRRRLRSGAAVAGAGVVVAGLLIGVPHLTGSGRSPIAGGVTTALMPNRPLSAAELRTAAGIVQRRMDAVGIRGTAAVSHGRLEVTTPVASGLTAAALAVRGELQFRQVLAAKAAAAGAGSLPQGAASLTDAERVYEERRCSSTATGADQATSAARYLVTCDRDFEYLLGPAELDNSAVRTAQPSSDLNANEWLVELQFNRAGGAAFLTLTARAAQAPDIPNCQPPLGCNALAIVVDGAVISNPRITDPQGIPGGRALIVGAFTETTARALAATVATQPLPAGFTATH